MKNAKEIGTFAKIYFFDTLGAWYYGFKKWIFDKVEIVLRNEVYVLVRDIEFESMSMIKNIKQFKKSW